MISRKLWQLLFRLGIAALALVILSLHVGKLDEAIASLQNVRISFIIIVVLLMFSNMFLQYLKWLYMLRIYYPDISRLETIGSIIGGFTLGIITPGGLGELGRGFFLKKYDTLHITGLTFIDKTFNNIANFFVGSLAFYYLFKYAFDLSIYVLVPYGIMIAIAWIVLCQLITHPQKIYGFLKRKEEKFPRLQKAGSLFQSLEKFRRRQFLIVLLFSLVFCLIVYTQFLLLLQAFFGYAILPALAAIVAALFSKNLLPISFGDLGIREGAAVYFLNQVHVAKIHAFEASLLLFTVNILFPSLVGLFLIPRLSLFKNKVK